MYQPAHIDGCSLVVLEPTNRLTGQQFAVIARGRFSFDGENLTLRLEDGLEIPFSDKELADVKIVHPQSKIPECLGFNFFPSAIQLIAKFFLASTLFSWSSQ
jgi:hypothetical protein